MKRERVPILNVAVDDISLDELLREFGEGILVTPNVDHLMTLQKDSDFYEIYQKADYITVDSQILYLAMKYLLRTPVREKVSGSDFFPAFCSHHLKNPDMTLFLLGGSPGAAEEIRASLNADAGREFVVGTCCPPHGFEKEHDQSRAIIDQINASGASALAVGLGAPKQEKWICDHRALLHTVKLSMGVGITIDFMAGRVKRAPGWMSKIGLEWFHRMLQDPVRLFKRYFIRDIPFFWLVLQQRMGWYRDPFERDE